MNQLLLVALVLDPKFKLCNFSHICKKKKMLHYNDQDVKTTTAAVKQLLIGLTNLYASSVNATASSNNLVV